MDLHDFSDIAENYDYYLNSLGSYSGFEEFYLSLAQKYGEKGIIDIACGTGALTIPLIKQGFDVIAVDLSKAMIDVTNKKLLEQGLSINTITANMTNFSLDRKFSLAIIARGGFMHLTTPVEQRVALLNIKSHLTDDGILTLHTFEPLVEAQYDQIHTSENDFSLRCEYTNKDGKQERIYNAIHYEPKTQIMSGNWRFDTLDDDGNVVSSRIRPLKMRQTYKTEMEYLIELCGFEVIDIFSGFNYQPANGILIWILKKVK
ncbi:MAG: hypothetical protein A2Y15_05120 [Clostridiales bacterium GWF2_36_10]|nr:MAG: hypothetical protein A2Y15_05120 [Clostridiales bacterium GWF2_36_10]HAN20236.1 hypothetical protein [Clostridiales bacterium]